MDKIIPIAILVLFIILTASWLFSRYRMCPPDKILIVFGKVGTGQPAKCYHGGSTFVLPVLQSYSYLDLNPINIDVPLQGALSSQNIRVDVPSSFIVGISTLPEIMQNAAARLLGRSREEIRNLAAEIIMGQMRVVIASMTIEEINSDREKLIKGITEGVDVELHKVGLHLINANITDIQDASGYINALGKEAAARAINDATIKVAEETRRGEIGKAEAEKDQTIQVANARAIAIEGQNEAQIKIAESAAKLQVKQAEAKKLAEVAQKVQEAKTLEEAYQAEKEAELKRAERERATQEANILVTARIEKSQREVQAQATAEVLKLEQEGKAQALLIQRRAEAEAIRQLAEGEAQATLLKKKAEGEGMEMVGRGEAAAIEAVLEGTATPLEFKLAKAVKKYDLRNDAQRLQYVDEAIGILAGSAVSPTARDVYAGRIAEQTGIDKKAVLVQLESAVRGAGRRARRKEQNELSRQGIAADIRVPYDRGGEAALGAASAARQLVAAMLQDAGAIPYIRERLNLGMVVLPEMQQAIKAIYDCAARGQPANATTLSPLLEEKAYSQVMLAQAQNADTRLTRRDIDMLLDRLQTANPESAQVAGTTDDEFRQKFAALARKKVGERPPEE